MLIFFLGLFLGANISLLFYALIICAKKADKDIELEEVESE